MHCLNEDTILTFVEGKLASEQLVDVESHARSCGTCEELLALGLARRSSTSRRAMASQRRATLSWRSHWWRALLVGALASAAAYLATGGGRLAAVTALIGVVAVQLWSARRVLRELRDLEDVRRMDALARVVHLPRPITTTGSGLPAIGAAQPMPPPAHIVAEVLLPQPGELLAGRYRVGPLLGAGGMSYVFSARDEAADETVALKLLRPELSLVPRWIERMAREVRIARSIRHPNVCHVMSFGQVGRHHFLTMELASRSLARELRFAAGGKPWHERLADAVAIVSGLGAVHAAGIVHRDLTPQNILRFSQGRLAIADFGLAVDQAGNSTAVAGTPNYIAPEILQGERPSFASDIWQLGVILHEMLFDCRPGQAAAAALASPASGALRDLCGRCADSVPTNRPADVNAIARALGAAAATRAS